MSGYKDTYRPPNIFILLIIGFIVVQALSGCVRSSYKYSRTNRSMNYSEKIPQESTWPNIEKFPAKLHPDAKQSLKTHASLYGAEESYEKFTELFFTKGNFPVARIYFRSDISGLKTKSSGLTIYYDWKAHPTTEISIRSWIDDSEVIFEETGRAYIELFKKVNIREQFDAQLLNRVSITNTLIDLAKKLDGKRDELKSIQHQFVAFKTNRKSKMHIAVQNHTKDTYRNHDKKQWAVVIGISDYQYSGQNGLTNLIFADDDAKSFAQSLRNHGWSDSHIKLLVNEQATRRNIMISLKSWLTKAGPDDQVILFWAGHGYPDPEDSEKVYFATYDTDISIPATGYRMDEVRRAVEELYTKNVIMFADTCHAGKLITRGNGDRGLSILPNIKNQRIPKGWVFMVGADTDRKAIEHTSWTNGAFTHSLLNGLNGAADGYYSAGEKDGVITMGELKEYMNTAMPDETHKVLGVAIRPVITTSAGDPDIWNLTLQAKQ